jgi:hypothetical protein
MAEKRTIELEIQDNSKSLKSQYKEAIQELQKVSQQYGETSVQAVKAARAAAELKDQIGFSKDLVDSFNPDAKFNSLTKSFGGVLDGFQAFEGALGLVGVEGEAVQKTMLKVQSAMALSQGLQGLGEARDSFKQLGTVAVNAFKGIKGAIAATGIGLLLVAVGTLYAYWDDIKEAVSGVSDEQTKLNKKTEANLKVAEAKVDSLNKQDNTLKLQGKTEKQILQYKITELDTTIKIAETNLTNQKATKKAQYEAAKANKDILMGIINFINKPLKFLLETVDAVGKAMGENFNLMLVFSKQESDFANLFFNPDAINTEGDAAIKAAEEKLIEIKNSRDGYQLQIQAIDQQAAKSSVNTASGAAKEIKDIAFDLEEERIRLMKDGQQKELDSLALQYARKKKETEKDETILAKDKEKLLNGLITGQKSDEALINEKYRLLEKEAAAKALEDKIKLQDEQWYALQKIKNSQQEQELLDLQIAYDKEYELAVNNDILQKELTDKFNKDSAAINKKYADEKKAADEKIAADKIASDAAQDAKDLARIQQKTDLVLKYAKTFSDVYSSLNNLMNASDNERLKGVKKGSKEEEAIKKQMFKRDKKLRIVQTIIDTASNVVTSVRNGGGIPTGIPFGIAAAAMGGLQIAAISKAKFSGEDGGGGGEKPTAPGGSMTAQFNTVGNNGINQLAQLQQQPTQAYVVSGQVTSQQALDRNRQQNSSL